MRKDVSLCASAILIFTKVILRLVYSTHTHFKTWSKHDKYDDAYIKETSKKLVNTSKHDQMDCFRELIVLTKFT